MRTIHARELAAGDRITGIGGISLGRPLRVITDAARMTPLKAGTVVIEVLDEEAAASDPRRYLEAGQEVEVESGLDLALARARREHRLTPTQAGALARLARAPGAWVGTRESGIAGDTLMALERRGLVEVVRVERPYRRLIGRLTSAGRCAVAPIV